MHSNSIAMDFGLSNGGDIAEILIYDSVLSSATSEDALLCEWSGHPPFSAYYWPHQNHGRTDRIEVLHILWVDGSVNTCRRPYLPGYNPGVWITPPDFKHSE